MVGSQLTASPPHLYGNAHGRDELGELSDPPRSVADHHVEGDESAIRGQASVQAPAQQGRVNIASAQGQNNSDKKTNLDDLSYTKLSR